MLEAVISFWLTYFIGGCFFYDDMPRKTIHGNQVPMSKILSVLGKNALLSFILLPLIDCIPTIIIVDYYLIRIMLLLVIGDIWFYWTHRLLHTSYLYQYHKMHHTFIQPHSLAGLYAHPVEYILSNYLSMMIPFKLISSPYPGMIIFEAALVAGNILKSHSSIESFIFGSPHHSRHHEMNNCNFGFLYINDLMFNTFLYTF